jgi:hypothetical protein
MGDSRDSELLDQVGSGGEQAPSDAQDGREAERRPWPGRVLLRLALAAAGTALAVPAALLLTFFAMVVWVCARHGLAPNTAIRADIYHHAENAAKIAVGGGALSTVLVAGLVAPGILLRGLLKRVYPALLWLWPGWLLSLAMLRHVAEMRGPPGALAATGLTVAPLLIPILLLRGTAMRSETGKRFIVLRVAPTLAAMVLGALAGRGVHGAIHADTDRLLFFMGTLAASAAGAWAWIATLGGRLHDTRR